MLSPELQQEYQKLRDEFRQFASSSPHQDMANSPTNFAHWLPSELYKIEYPLAEKSARLLAHALENGHIEPVHFSQHWIFKDLQTSYPHIVERQIVDKILSDPERGADALYGLKLSPENHKKVIERLMVEHQGGSKAARDALKMYASNSEAPFTADDLYFYSKVFGSHDNGTAKIAKNLAPDQRTPFTRLLSRDVKSGKIDVNHVATLLRLNVALELKAKYLEQVTDAPNLMDHLSSWAGSQGSDWRQVFQILPEHVLQKISKLDVPSHYDNMKHYDAMGLKRVAFNLSDPLAKAANFWYGYEKDVEPEHFAVGRSLHTNQPETITDHRGETGTSEPHMDLLPHLKEYAKKTQEAVIEHIKQKNLIGFEKNGKWYVDVYRGVGGNLAQELIDKVSIPTRKPAEMGFLFKDKHVRFPASHMSSWTVVKSVARRFARRKISGHQKDVGVIMKASMPVSHLLHSGFMDMYAGQEHAHPDESELIFHHPGNKPMHVVHPKDIEVVSVSSGDTVPATVESEDPITKSEDIVKMLHNDNTDGVHHAFHKQDFNSTEDKVSHVQKLHEVAHSVVFDPNARASFIRHLIRTDDTHALKMILEDTGVSGFHKLAKDFDQLTGSDFRLYVMNNIVAKPEVLETDSPAFGDIVEDAVAHHANSLDAILSPLAQAPKVTNLYVLSALVNTAYAEHPDKMFEELKVPTKTVYKLPAKAQMGFIVHNIKAQDMHNKYDVVKMADALHDSMGDAFNNKLKEQLKDVSPTNPLLVSVRRNNDKHGLEDELTVKAGSGVLRKLRDHLLSAGDITPNDLPEGKWNSITKKVGKATVADWEPLLEKNGKLSAAKVQDYLDRMEGTTYGFSLSTTPEGETVFNLKIPKHELRKLHATGADETLRRLVHLSQGSGNPAEDRTVGWMKFKNNPDGHMEVTEVQSDLDMDMADTLRKQMEKEYGTVDEGEYGRHLEKLHTIYPPAHLHQLQELVFKGRPSADVIREAFHEYARKNEKGAA